tara:strand:- start:80 stop:247 length:168 start_codon:yes stop_codon:yes gene_type:complete
MPHNSTADDETSASANTGDDQPPRLNLALRNKETSKQSLSENSEKPLKNWNKKGM